MKFLKIFFAAILVSLLSSCYKPMPCEVNGTGTLKVSTTKYTSYMVYVDDVYQGDTYPASETVFIGIQEGYYEVKMINPKNFNEVWVANTSIFECETSTVVF